MALMIASQSAAVDPWAIALSIAAIGLVAGLMPLSPRARARIVIGIVLALVVGAVGVKATVVDYDWSQCAYPWLLMIFFWCL